MQGYDKFASQEQIVEAADAPSPVVRKWVTGELMPEPRRVGGGHAQGTRNLWPPWAVERARWIREQLAQGLRWTTSPSWCGTASASLRADPRS
ncbi:hypothetical protein [Nannocystis pusilla]|uniref:hypothetical protein n=1 Tax=Nannocystis pusilla TaxID=889268 RepID=UPI003B7850AA